MEKEINKEKGDSLTVYEVSYLLLPSLAMEQVPAEVAAIKEAIQAAGGAMISNEDPILIDLAYPMVKVVQTVREKAKSGYFGWMKFELDPSGAEAVKKSLDSNDKVLRYLIIKTVRENTLLHGKMKLQKDLPQQSDKALEEGGEVEGVDPAKEASPEEVDKSIDDLVIA